MGGGEGELRDEAEVEGDEKRKIMLTRRCTGKKRSLNIGCILSFDWILKWKYKGHLYL